MMTTDVHTLPVESALTEQLDRVSRLHFNNPTERPAHIQAFLAWLPLILKTAPGMCWERLPSVVMGYLIHATDMADTPEIVAIALAVGCAMDAMKPKTLYTYCIAVTNLFRHLRKTYGMVTLSDLIERRVWYQVPISRNIPARGQTEEWVTAKGSKNPFFAFQWARV
jgi:hypothetical protein